MRILRESTEELRKEVMQKKLEIKNLREDLTSKQKQSLKEQKELEDLLEYQVTLKVCCFTRTYVNTDLQGHKMHGCHHTFCIDYIGLTKTKTHKLKCYVVVIDPIRLNLGSGDSQKISEYSVASLLSWSPDWEKRSL